MFLKIFFLQSLLIVAIILKCNVNLWDTNLEMILECSWPHGVVFDFLKKLAGSIFDHLQTKERKNVYLRFYLEVLITAIATTFMPQKIYSSAYSVTRQNRFK